VPLDLRLLEAATAATARAAAAALKPDAVLVDVVLGDGDGIVLAGELTAESAVDRRRA
jgi:DNA-binding response OmpR family regulator